MARKRLQLFYHLGKTREKMLRRLDWRWVLSGRAQKISLPLGFDHRSAKPLLELI
jgi:hypothetical protein